MRFSRQSYITLLATTLWFITGCGGTTTTTTTVTGNGLPSGPPEKAYCPYLPSKTFSGQTTITVSGSAGYSYRLNGKGQLGTISASTNPIRYAEVRVLDNSNNIIQCAETSGTGTFSFALPNDGQRYSIRVVSRGQNSHVQASVLDRPEYNTPYEISSSFYANGTQTIPQIKAEADQSKDSAISGGAFNIFDQIVNANYWLSSQTASCATTYANCNPFSVAPKITAYWSAGFNPGQYFNSSNAISFYLPGNSMLFILGGIDGDVDNSDNDHFDNSVIVHEYGHFIEDIYAKTNSPGGSHNGKSVIDPRLAWGEGWANFFQAAVTGIPIYRDTYGTSDGVFGVYFSEDLENPVNDVPTNAGEGIFHEFSVSRALWDVIDPHPISGQGTNEGASIDNVTTPFAELWYLFTNSTYGFANSNLHFRNMALWHKNQTALGVTNLSSVRTGEKQSNILDRYATPVVTNLSCVHTDSVTGAKSASDNGAFSTSNQFKSNRFYHLSHPGGAANITLNYTYASSATDLDLYLYNEAYTYGLASTMAGFSNTHSGTSEQISLGYLPAGEYMINVMVFTQNTAGSTATFDLYYNGSKLCVNP